MGQRGSGFHYYTSIESNGFCRYVVLSLCLNKTWIVSNGFIWVIWFFLGPPPLGKEVIDSLPVIQIEEDQVNKKLQCSVCWEDFILNEDVRQLPCSHVYHDGCIRPWLELHGTCPICRQNLGNNEQQSSDTNLPNTIENGKLLCLSFIFFFKNLTSYYFQWY